MNNQDVPGSAPAMLPVQKAAPTRTKPPKPRQLHGFTKALKGRYKADAAQLDGRSAASIAMSAYRANLVSSLGGKDNLSVQEITIVELCSRDWQIIQQIDAYLLTVGMFSKRKKAAWPLLATGLQVADSLARKLQSLGLHRRSRPVQSLSQLLSASPEPNAEGRTAPTPDV